MKDVAKFVECGSATRIAINPDQVRLVREMGERRIMIAFDNDLVVYVENDFATVCSILKTLAN